MIRSFSATTREIDDADAAVAEVLSQLDIEKNLLKYSLGIVSYFSEFEDTGVLKAVCGALPFDTVGATTCLCAAGEDIDQIILAITVLTSDDCEFRTTAVTINEDYMDSVNRSVTELLSGHEGRPSLVLAHFPLINTIGGDSMLDAVDRASGSIPVFGTIATDHHMDYSTIKTMHNGETFHDLAVLAFVYGKVNVTFDIAALNEDKIRKQRAIITKSADNLLIGVNGKSVKEYLDELGLMESEFGMGIVPFVIDRKDGTKPVARSVCKFTPEGYAICGAGMPEGATLSIGRVDAADVLSTAEASIKSLVENDSVVLIYSCLARYMALGLNVTTEAEMIRGASGGMSYHFAYSGGEVCPLRDAEGMLRNCFHNYSIIFCRLS